MALDRSDPRLTLDGVRTSLWAVLRAAAATRRREHRWPVEWNSVPKVGNADWNWHISSKLQIGRLLVGPDQITQDDVSHAGFEWMLEMAVAELVHSGIVTRSVTNADHYHITPHGMQCLEVGDPNFPLDAAGRVDALRAEFSGAPDLDLLLRYLSEAIQAYRHGLTLAGATMIGCAYELALLELATAVLAKWPPGSIPTVSGRIKDAAQKHAAGEYASAGLLADAAFKTLEANSKAIGEEWRWVASCFAPTFFIVRELRNDAGHPSGNAVPRDEVFTHIVNFCPTYRHVRAIIAKL